MQNGNRKFLQKGVCAKKAMKVYVFFQIYYTFQV